MLKQTFLLLVYTVLSFSVQAQISSPLEENLRKHIQYLASDSLHGRRTGTADEKKAAQYISTQFQKLGLKPMGDNNTWLQAFTYTTTKIASNKTTLMLNGMAYALHHSYEALVFSGSADVMGKNAVNVGYGIENNEANRHDYNGKDVNDKVVVIKAGSDVTDPHSPVNTNIDAYSKALLAQQKGAAAVLFITAHPSPLIHMPYEKSKNLAIPVIVMISDTIVDETTVLDAHIDMENITRTGYNVLGYCDNHASSTVVIGGHYDHLGYGEDGNSLYRGDKAIHNGADDNASGTAAVIELARILCPSDNKKNNYLFICFSGEELGLYGSKYLVHHLPIDSASINYMINMDMLGRYRDEKGIEVGGLGTSSDFGSLKKTLKASELKIHESQSGMGPSDFTSFYLANHPVLNFFTGTHEDYHKPSDKADKINYVKESYIIEHLIVPVVNNLDSKGKLSFTPTKDYDKQNDVPQFKVRLGIIPDYMYDGNGLRVDGVSPGNPAEKAGLKTGDIIIQMEDVKVTDIQTYMRALSTFKSGQTITTYIKRGKEEMKVKVTF